MELLYLLEKIRVPILNAFMLGITYLGDEIAFLLVTLILYWCFDKKKGYYVLALGCMGTVANQFLKLLFRIPRPWVKDSSFTILEQAREGASGYSFPSGHTQNAVGTFGGIAAVTKQKAVRILCILVAVLVPLSRMYVGVHTPLDTSVAALMAIFLIFALRPLIWNHEGKHIPALLGGTTVFAFAYLLFVELYPFPADVDTQNLLSGTKNAYTLVGALLGFLVAYYVDTKWLHFPVKAVWWAQLLKVCVGIALVLGVKTGLSAPLKALLGEYAGRMVRYFLTVLTAGVIWPLTFKWFSKLGTKRSEEV